MSRRAWLTPETIPGATICRALVIPADYPGIVTAVSGAIYPLTLAENWEPFGAVTPEQIAAAMQTMYLNWLKSDCEPTMTFPIGVLMPKAGGTLPTGWLWCDGSAISRTTYAALFAEIGTAYGIGDGSTTFNLPDVEGQVVAGAGQPFSGGSTFVEGVLTGTERITLALSEIPVHDHVMTNAAGAVSKEAINVTTVTSNFQPGTAKTYPAGGGSSHNNMQPTAFVAGYIIYAGV